MADDFIPVGTTGKNLQTQSNTIAGQLVHAEAVYLVDVNGNPITSLAVTESPTTGQTATGNTIGLTLVYQPVAGKSARVSWYHITGSPTNSANVIVSLRFGTSGTDFVTAPLSQYGGALAHAPGAGRRYYQGAVDQGLYMNLSAAQSVTVNIDVEDV